MPTTRQTFLRAVGIASASLGLRPAGVAPQLAAPVPPPPAVDGVTRLTAPAAGVYHVSGRVEWAAQAPPSIHTLALRLRGTTLAYAAAIPWEGMAHEQTVTTLTFLKEEDVRALELVAYGNSGGALTLASPDVRTVRVT